MSTHLGIFAKHWTPGLVKTRLAASIGEDRAALLSRAFLVALVGRLTSLADVCGLCYAPSSSHDAFRALLPKDWQLKPQSEGDLGQRMHHFFDTSWREGLQRVVLLGSDSPDIPQNYVHQAFTLLEKYRLVLGPTEDGGYYLVGAQSATPPIFKNMPWSTSELWPATLQKLDDHGWKEGVDYAILPMWYDVDRLADLQRLRDQLLDESQQEPALAELLSQVHLALADQ